MAEIKELGESYVNEILGVIRRSFATVAEEFSLTEENVPKHPAFIKEETLHKRFADGIPSYGLFEGGIMVGYIAVSEEEDGYMLHNLAVLPEYRHMGFGRQLLDFSAEKIRRAGGKKMLIDIIDDNTVLKNWYIGYGFIPLRTERFPSLPFTVCFMEMPLDELDRRTVI